MKQQESLRSRVKRHLEGGTSQQESHELEHFMDAYGEGGQWSQFKEDPEHIKNQIWGRVRQQLGHKPKVIAINSVWQIGIAASVALLLGVFLWSRHEPSPKWNTLVTTHTVDSLGLADGSWVYLQRNSQLQYPNEFSGGPRQVKLLAGGAFFKVARNPKKPFEVHSGSLTTRVLGTSFLVTKQSEQEQVTVSSGKVMVASDSDQLFLLPDEQVTWSANAHALKKNQVNSKVYDSWLAPEVDLDNVSLGELALVLEYKYGVRMKFDGPQLKEIRVKLTLLKEETLEQLVSKLNFITDVQLKIKENHVVTVTDQT